MRLTTVVFPKGEMVLGVLGITEQDVIDMQAGLDVEPVDLRLNFKLGQPLPNTLKLIYVKDSEDYERRLAAAGLDVTKLVPLNYEEGEEDR